MMLCQLVSLGITPVIVISSSAQAKDLQILVQFKVPIQGGLLSKTSTQIWEGQVGKVVTKERSIRHPQIRILTKFSNASFATVRYRMLSFVLLAPSFAAETASKSG